MHRLARLRSGGPIRRSCHIGQSRPELCSTRPFTTTQTRLQQDPLDDFDTEEPNNQPRRSRNQQLSSQRDAIKKLDLNANAKSRDIASAPRQTPQIRRTQDRSQERASAPARTSSRQPQRNTRQPQASLQSLNRNEQDLEEAAENDIGDGPLDPREHLYDYDSQFTSDAELTGYADVMDRTSKLLARHKNIREVQKSPAVAQNPNGDVAKRCEVELRELDTGIKEALDAMQRMKDAAYVPHRPEGVSLKEFYRQKVGAAAVGDGGAGNVVEDSLRHLARRDGHKWQNPRHLAQRLISGEFVKFRSHTERREVMEALQLEAQEQGGRLEWKDVKFSPLEAEARREVVRRAVQGDSKNDRSQEGELVEAGRMKGPQDVVKTAERLVGGQYRGEQVEMVRRAIEELLPQQAGQQGGQQRQVRD